MPVVYWELTPWYLRIIGFVKYRRRVRSLAREPEDDRDYWEYYDRDKHGRGMFF